VLAAARLRDFQGTILGCFKAFDRLGSVSVKVEKRSHRLVMPRLPERGTALQAGFPAEMGRQFRNIGKEIAGLFFVRLRKQMCENLSVLQRSRE